MCSCVQCALGYTCVNLGGTDIYMHDIHTYSAEDDIHTHSAKDDIHTYSAKDDAKAVFARYSDKTKRAARLSSCVCRA
jgi:hypothetical protein